MASGRRQDGWTVAETQLDQPELVSLHEAAERLDLSTEAVRKRIQRGTLSGRKIDGVWYVEASNLPVLPSSSRPAMASSASSGRQDDGVQPVGLSTQDGRTSGETSAPPVVDLSPLVALIDRLHAENRQLTEAATAWQIRAMQAEERLKAIEGGSIDNQADAALAANKGSGEAMSAATTEDAEREDESLWGRFWRALTGRSSV